MLTRVAGKVGGTIAVVTTIVLAGVALIVVPAAADATAAHHAQVARQVAAAAAGQVVALASPTPTTTPAGPQPWSNGLILPAYPGPLVVDNSPCQYNVTKENCHDATHGWFNPFDECYWLAAGTAPGGTTYSRSCGPETALVSAAAIVSTTPPPGYNQTVNAQVTAAITAVVAFNGILAPIEAVEPKLGPGLVGLPAWLWADETLVIKFLDVLGPVAPAIKVGPLSISANLLSQSLMWDMGNGTTVNCNSIGLPYNPATPTAPACGYTYTQPGKYTVAARSVWFVSIVVAGLATTVLLVRNAIPQIVNIKELQVVTQ